MNGRGDSLDRYRPKAEEEKRQLSLLEEVDQPAEFLIDSKPLIDCIVRTDQEREEECRELLVPIARTYSVLLNRKSYDLAAALAETAHSLSVAYNGSSHELSIEWRSRRAQAVILGDQHDPE